MDGVVVWGTPTTALWMERIGVQRAKRLLLTGDLISGKQAVEWCDARWLDETKRTELNMSGPSAIRAGECRGLALECAPAHLLDAVFENLLERYSSARTPFNCGKDAELVMRPTRPLFATRVSLMPINQLIMQKQVCNHFLLGGSLQTAQMMSVYFDGTSRHTAEVRDRVPLRGRPT